MRADFGSRGRHVPPLQVNAQRIMLISFKLILLGKRMYSRLKIKCQLEENGKNYHQLKSAFQLLLLYIYERLVADKCALN